MIDRQTRLVDVPREQGAAGSVLIEYIYESSRQVITPLLPYLLQTETLHVCCAHIVDSTVQAHFAWQEPEHNQLCWWYNLKDEQSARSWLECCERKLTLDWHLSVASAYFSAAFDWYSENAEDMYVSERKNYEYAHCSVLRCGEFQGLALDLSIALESEKKESEVILESLPIGVTKHNESVSLADISTGIPQVLAGSAPGQWLPPFYNGESWLLLRVDRIERPSFAELKPILMRQAVQKWRDSNIMGLVDYWLRKITEPESHA